MSCRLAVSRLCWLLLLLGIMSGCASPGSEEVARDAGAADAAATDAAGGLDADQPPGGDAVGDQSDGTATPVVSKPLILTVAPETGSSSGLTEVEITGIGLGTAIGVYFDESPGIDLQVLDDYTLRVQSPPRKPGFVDVTVRITDLEGNASEISLPLSFRYLADVQVHSVSPKAGPHNGGSLVTVTGNGFTPTTAFIFGDRLAIDPLVLDEFTASMHTPPGPVGRVAVSAGNADGAATLKNAYEYTGASTLKWVAPATSPIGGGTTLRVHGTALGGTGSAVSIMAPSKTDQNKLKPYNAGILAVAKDGSWLDIKAPAIMSSGAFDLVYTRKGKALTLAKGVTYIGATDPATGKQWNNAVVGLSPASAPVNVAKDVAIVVVGPIARQTNGQVEVRLSSSKVPVLWHDVGTQGPGQQSATIVVRLGPATWTVLPTKASIRVDVGYEDATGVGAFTWLPPIPKIVKVTPSLLSTAGGSPFTVHWGPKAVGFGAVVGVRIGALFATSINPGLPSKHAAMTVSGLAPKGSPGPADVQLILGNGTAIAANAVQFGGGVPKVAAITPGRGAVAGGSLVDLIGSGLSDLDRVFIGDKQVKDLKVIHPGLARFRTPPGKPGPATLMARYTNGNQQTLAQAYIYFDPVAGNYGTWGEPIDRDVNVTVMQSNMGGGRVPDATVVVERGEQVWTGVTDKNGQVVISAPNLTGPVTVSAAKPGYTAASVVKVGVRNVTVRLRKATAPPPSSGTGEPPPGNKPDPFPDGVINGTVSNSAKYTQLPMGDCKTQPAVGGNCKPCTTAKECFAGQTCELLRDPLQGFDLGAGGNAIPGATPVTQTNADPQRYCMSDCLKDTDCPGDFECRAIGLTTGAPLYRCTPRIGFAQTRCETSSPSMWGGNPKPGAGFIANDAGKFSIASRLGDVAVYCRSGYVEKGSGQFIPLMLGVTRGIHVLPGATVNDVKVTLTTPMTRTVRVRLDRIPMGDDVIGFKRYMVAALYLETEGYIQMADVETTLRTDVISLPRQPWSLKGALSTIRYDMYGGLSNPLGGSPVSIAAREDVRPADADHLAWWPKKEGKPLKSDAWSVPTNAMATDGYTTVAVGDRGWIGVWGGTAFTQQATPTQHDLYSVWMAPGASGDGWAGGERQTLLRRNNVTGWQAYPSPVAQPPAGSPPDAGRIRAIAGRSADDVWLLTGRNELYHWDGKAWSSAFAGPLAPPKSKPNTWGAWQELPRLRAMHHMADGALIVVGDGGYLVRGYFKNGKLSWQLIASGTKHALYAVWGISSADFWFCGDAGTLRRYSGGTTTPVDTGTLLPLYDVTGTPNGVQAVGGLGAWVEVALDGKVTNVSIDKLSVDLMAVAPFPGGVVAAGQPMVVMGPYLELPYIVLPKINGPMGDKLKWTAKPGVTPTLHLVRITDYSYRTLWELYVKGDVTEVDLPDFEKLAAFNPLPGGKMRVRLWRIYAPGLTIDHYNHKQLSVWKWVSYAYNWVMTSQVTDLSGTKLPPPGVPGGGNPQKLPAFP